VANWPIAYNPKRSKFKDKNQNARQTIAAKAAKYTEIILSALVVVVYATRG
jgi:hypothetical protein